MTVALLGSSTIVAERYASFCHRFGDMSQTRPIIVLKQTGDHSPPLCGSRTWKVLPRCRGAPFTGETLVEIGSRTKTFPLG